MKQIAFVLVVGAAGCAAPAQFAPHSSEFPAAAEISFEPVAPSAAETGPAPARSDAAAALVAIPTGVVASPRWSAAGSDEAPATTEVKVTAPREGENESPLREERRIGSNKQPEWTTERTFATTRAYVIAPGQIELEQWYKLQTPDGSAPNHFWQTELAFGFEGGWQVDLYWNYGKEPDGPTKHRGGQVEVRKALADWGQIPLNPTLYLEYVQEHRAPDKIEAKILLAEELCVGWHWAMNLIYEQEMGGERETELAASMGLMYSVVDSKFGAGFEIKAERVTGDGFQSAHDSINEFLIGPSFQWRPTANTHLDIVPLFGLTKSDRDDPRLELYIVFGIDIGPDLDARRAPVSTGSK